MQPNIGQLVNLLMLVSTNKLHVTVSHHFNLHEAMGILEQGHGRGKLCFKVS